MAERPKSHSPDAAAKPGAAYLIKMEKGQQGKIFQIEPAKPVGIGRASDNAIPLADEECSRYHAKLVPETNGWRIVDLGSTNGTRVNDIKIEGTFTLSDNDRIDVGDTQFVFVSNLKLAKVDPEKADIQVSEGLHVRQRRKRNQAVKIGVTTVRADGWEEDDRPSASARRLCRHLAEIGAARTPEEFARTYLLALTDATAANLGGLYVILGSAEPTLLATATPANENYMPPSPESMSYALKDREAILGDEVAPRRPGGRPHKRCTICAPIFADEEIVAVLHLYNTEPRPPLTGEDLDLIVGSTMSLGNSLIELQKSHVAAMEMESMHSAQKVESEIVGSSSALAGVVKKVAQLANLPTPLLVHGESGVGKKLVARSIHYASDRMRQPLVYVNCTANADVALEGDLFGFERGAFSGAFTSSRGKMEIGNRGTVVLEEIGSMPGSIQSKLMRVLDGHPFERVGGTSGCKSTFRLIATSSRDLDKLVAEGHFRGDLLERLKSNEIRVPPLREHPQDIPLLAQYFLRRFATDFGKKVQTYSPGALLKLGKYAWPGNVRELRNIVERTVQLCNGATVESDEVQLAGKSAGAQPAGGVAVYRPIPLQQVEADHILRTLRYTGWNRVRAAQVLGIDKTALEVKIVENNLQHEGAPRTETERAP